MLREVARHLAVRMSFEDLIRVAQAKIDPKRFDRIATELAAKPGEPFSVVEFLKPGIEEMCQILPPSLARRIIDFVHAPQLDRPRVFPDACEYHLDQRLPALLAARKIASLAPRTFRYQEEQTAIESWLALILRAARNRRNSPARSPNAPA